MSKEEYLKIVESNSTLAKKIEPRIDELVQLFDTFTTSPRRSLSIASFTTSYDNRNMWENYANFYTGFCVEYDFSKAGKSFNAKSAWDVLHFLPISYYAKRPLFKYDNILDRIFEADLKISEFSLKDTDFLPKYYQSILAKQYDYRSEREWRLIMKRKNQGTYGFPYISRILIGKDASQSDIETLSFIGKDLGVSVFFQSISEDGNSFKYKPL